MIKKTLFLLLVMTFSGCLSPVRHGIFSKRTPLPAEAQAEEKALLKPAETERFKDTVIMATGSVGADLMEQMAQADELFKKKRTKQACEIYEQLSQTVAEGDSLDYEVRFMLSECSAENQDFERSLGILKALTASEGIPQEVLEKSLVRLGQVYCVLERRNEANAAFTLLKQSFPDSRYLQIASCDAVK